MSTSEVTRDLDKLDSQLEKLEAAVQPLLGDLSDVASGLPLLDRAKLYSLTAYTLESLLFSALRVQGVDAQNHAITAELKRVQGHFEKIGRMENPQEPEQRSSTVNTVAATRILKADLGSNSSDLKNRLAEQIAKERAKALLKSYEGGKRAAEESASPTKGGAKKKQKPTGRELR